MQTASLYVRELQDMRQRAEGEAHVVKAAMVAYAGYPAFSELFVPQEERDKQAAEDLSKEDFDEPTKWIFERSADFTPEDADRLLDEILARQGEVTASGGDLLGLGHGHDEGPIPIEWGDS